MNCARTTESFVSSVSPTLSPSKRHRISSTFCVEKPCIIDTSICVHGCTKSALKTFVFWPLNEAEFIKWRAARTGLYIYSRTFKHAATQPSNAEQIGNVKSARREICRSKRGKNSYALDGGAGKMDVPSESDGNNNNNHERTRGVSEVYRFRCEEKNRPSSLTVYVHLFIVRCAYIALVQCYNYRILSSTVLFGIFTVVYRRRNARVHNTPVVRGI